MSEDRSSIRLDVVKGTHNNYTITSYKRNPEYAWKEWLVNYFADPNECMTYLMQFCHSRPQGQVDINFRYTES